MSDNHNHDRLEELERLLHAGQPSSDELLNDLAGTMPQARPAFQQALERQLVATLKEQQPIKRRSNLLMQLSHRQAARNETQRARISVPVTLVAAIAAVLLAGLLLSLMSNLPPKSEPEMIFGEGGPDATTTPTAEGALRATVNALETRFAEVQAQLDSAPTMTSEQTAQAPAMPSSVVATAAPAACQMQVFTLYADPDVTSPVVATILPDQVGNPANVAGALDDFASGQHWLWITYYDPANGSLLTGWVQADSAITVCWTGLRESGEMPVPTLSPARPANPFQFAATPTIVGAMWQAEESPTSVPLPTLPFTPTPIPVGNADIEATPIFTITPTLIPTPTWEPTAMPPAGVSLEVNIRVADPAIADLFPLVGELVDVFIAVGDPAQGTTIVPVARGILLVKVMQASGATITNATVIAHNAEQAELLAGLASAGIEIKLSPVA